jgi:hypothetical protein
MNRCFSGKKYLTGRIPRRYHIVTLQRHIHFYPFKGGEHQMNIRKSALYLVGGLYFLFFSAACVCNHPGTGAVQPPDSPKQEQQAAVPAQAVENAAGEEVIMEEGTTTGAVSGDEGVVVEEATTTEAVSGDEGVVVEEATTTEAVSGDEGVVVEEGTTSTTMPADPADGTPVSE